MIRRASAALKSYALSCRCVDPVSDPPPAYWLNQSNLPTIIPFEGAQPSGSKITVATLDVDGIDGKIFEEILAFMDIAAGRVWSCSRAYRICKPEILQHSSALGCFKDGSVRSILWGESFRVLSER